MAVGTIAGTVYTPPVEAGFMANLTGGLRAPMLAETEVLDSSSAFWAAGVYGFIGSWIGGVFGRKHERDGVDPVGGFYL